MIKLATLYQVSGNNVIKSKLKIKLATLYQVSCNNVIKVK